MTRLTCKAKDCRRGGHASTALYCWFCGGLLVSETKMCENGHEADSGFDKFCIICGARFEE